MKKFCTLSIAVFLIATNALFPAKAFEGQYDMNFKGEDVDIVTSFWVKGGHMKMRHHGSMGQMGDIIMRDGMSTMIIVMPQQKAYLEMPVPTEGDFADPEQDEVEEMPFKKTGESKEILGLKAEQFIYESGQDKMIVWATDELGSMPFARNQMFDAWAAAMREISGQADFFPLETVIYSGGKETARMKVVKVEKKELPDSTFLPTEGYRKMVMPAGLGGFMGK